MALSLSGGPDKPPFSFIFHASLIGFLYNLSLVTVVLVRTTPSIVLLIKISLQMFSRFFFDMSGDNFKKVGFLFLILDKVLSNFSIFPFSWMSLNPGVLGEDILMVI